MINFKFFLENTESMAEMIEEFAAIFKTYGMNDAMRHWIQEYFEKSNFYKTQQPFEVALDNFIDRVNGLDLPVVLKAPIKVADRGQIDVIESPEEVEISQSDEGYYYAYPPHSFSNGQIVTDNGDGTIKSKFTKQEFRQYAEEHFEKSFFYRPISDYISHMMKKYLRSFNGMINLKAIDILQMKRTAEHVYHLEPEFYEKASQFVGWWRALSQIDLDQEFLKFIEMFTKRQPKNYSKISDEFIKYMLTYLENVGDL